MDVFKDKYIIMELIPSHSKSELGEIIQLQALKLNGLQLIERFDYRLDYDKILNKDLQAMISYDNHLFTYVDKSDAIMKAFKKFSLDLPLLIIDNDYTKDYLKGENCRDIIKKLALSVVFCVIPALLFKFCLPEPEKSYSL